jgi:hypothetical protein
MWMPLLNTRLAVLQAFATIGAVVAGASTAKEERLQVGEYAPEESLSASSLDPSVQSIRWLDGDLEVRLVQAAPCGEYLVANPVWEKAATTVILRYEWVPRYPNTAKPTTLCKKHLRAWVFRVPNAKYTVLVSDAVPRYIRRGNDVQSSIK